MLGFGRVWKMDSKSNTGMKEGLFCSITAAGGVTANAFRFKPWFSRLFWAGEGRGVKVIPS